MEPQYRCRARRRFSGPRPFQSAAASIRSHAVSLYDQEERPAVAVTSWPQGSGPAWLGVVLRPGSSPESAPQYVTFGTGTGRPATERLGRRIAYRSLGVPQTTSEHYWGSGSDSTNTAHDPRIHWCHCQDAPGTPTITPTQDRRSRRAVQSQSCRAAELPSCRAAELPSCRPNGASAASFQRRHCGAAPSGAPPGSASPPPSESRRSTTAPAAPTPHTLPRAPTAVPRDAPAGLASPPPSGRDPQAGSLLSVDVVPTQGDRAIHDSLRAPGIVSVADVHVL